MKPIVLHRQGRSRYLATGIWEPMQVAQALPIEECKTVEDLFWAVLGIVSQRAKAQDMLVSVIAMPGWGYETNIGSLPKWSPEEVRKSGRVLWKRTPLC